mmetsp:Transcript_14019/g.25043  ORF Transcript_14019/g.25043 Transcript_14019/m.25043 type:complete len:92 (+) Transcript_14019:349-624(+)
MQAPLCASSSPQTILLRTCTFRVQQIPFALVESAEVVVVATFFWNKLGGSPGHSQNLIPLKNYSMIAMLLLIDRPEAHRPPTLRRGIWLTT